MRRAGRWGSSRWFRWSAFPSGPLATSLVPSEGQSTLTAGTYAPAADGTTTSTQTLTVRDPSGNPVPNVQVTMAFARKFVDAALSSVTADTPILNDGIASSSILNTILNTDGNPVVGVPAASVVQAATGTGNTLTQPSTPTNADGVAGGSLKSTVAATKVASVTAMGLAVTDTASIVVDASAPATLHTEAWAFANTAAMLADAASVYTETYVSPYVTGTGTITLDIGGGQGGENFVRNTFPDVTSWTSDVVVVNGSVDRIDDYTIRQQKNFAAGLETISGGGFEFFMRFRFSANWTTFVPAGWGEGAQDHKTLLLYPYPPRGGDRWSVKIGAGVWDTTESPVKVGDPVLGDRATNIKVYNPSSDPEILGSTYWNNAWHTMRIRVTGLGGASGQTDILLDDVLVDRVTGRDYTDFTGLDYYNPGANRNQGQDVTMTYDTGLITGSEYP